MFDIPSLNSSNVIPFLFMEEHFEKITQSVLFPQFEKSLDLLLENQLPFEVRTTVHSELIPEKDIQQMIIYLENKKYSGNYYLQYFINGVKTLENLGHSLKILNEEKLSTSKIKVSIRG